MDARKATELFDRMEPMSKTPPDNDDPRIARTRQHALHAALELVAESGLSGYTFETVSERSGISRSTLYRHWDNKSESNPALALGARIHQGTPRTLLFQNLRQTSLCLPE